MCVILTTNMLTTGKLIRPLVKNAGKAGWRVNNRAGLIIQSRGAFLPGAAKSRRRRGEQALGACEPQSEYPCPRAREAQTRWEQGLGTALGETEGLTPVSDPCSSLAGISRGVGEQRGHRGAQRGLHKAWLGHGSGLRADHAGEVPSRRSGACHAGSSRGRDRNSALGRNLPGLRGSQSRTSRLYGVADKPLKSISWGARRPVYTPVLSDKGLGATGKRKATLVFLVQSRKTPNSPGPECQGPVPDAAFQPCPWPFPAPRPSFLNERKPGCPFY